MVRIGGAIMELGRAPTFIVGSQSQRSKLESLVRREQVLFEAYQKNKELCFNGKAYQKTHPLKAFMGQKDADATLCSPMLLGIADGVSQIEEFGIDASELPNELLCAVEELAVSQLLPGQESEEYMGPITMVRDAYENTESFGSTTILTAVMDNSTKIHGKTHPMIAVCSIGDCEILILRRGDDGQLQLVFQTEMQRIDGNAQSPLQLARVDETVDPDFDESIAIEVIEQGSAVHCISAFEGDIVILGSDGVFDNLFPDEIVALCEEMLPGSGMNEFQAADRHVLEQIARRIVTDSHAKTQPDPVLNNYRPAPIGAGGKIDDTACVVAQVVEWTPNHGEAWAELRSERAWRNFLTCGGNIPHCESGFDCIVEDGEPYEHQYEQQGYRYRNYPEKPNANSFSTYRGSFSISEYDRIQGQQPASRRPRTVYGVYEEREEPSILDAKCAVM